MMGLMVIILPALLTGVISSKSGKVGEAERLKGVAYLREAEVALRSIKEEGWTAYILPVVSGSDYYPEYDGTSKTWNLQPGIETITTGYTRKVVFSDVYRDAAGVMYATTALGRTLDTSTKKVDFEVAWTQPLSSSVTSSIYLTRYASNVIKTETLPSDFTAGQTITGTLSITGTNPDGEVSLGKFDTGRGDWCVPVIAGSLNVTSKAAGAAASILANPFEAFVGLGLTTANPSLVKVSITDTVPPTTPVASLAGQFPASGAGYVTRDIYGIGNFAYLATTDNTKEIVILQKSGANFAEIGTFRATTSNADADSVFVSGTRGFMTQANTLRIFDLTSNTGIRSQLGSATFGSAAATGEVFVRGNFAFVAVKGVTNKMEIFNVTTNTPVNVAFANFNSSTAQDIFVNSTGSRAYIVTSNDAALPEFFIVNTSNLNLPYHQVPVIGSYNMPDSMSPTT